jgi:hypothetical protein
MDSKQIRIEEIKQLLSQAKDKTSFAYLKALNSLKVEYELVDDMKNACIYADEIINLMVNQGVTYNDVHNAKTNEILVTAYDTKARSGDFRSYCIALEWNRPINKKFYVPRMRLLEKHGVTQGLQDLQDDKLDLMVLNLPPRVGKSTISLFFLTFRAGLYPDNSILGNGHSTSLTQSFYNEFLEVVTSDEYRFKEIFPHIDLVNKSSEYSFLDFNRKKRFHTIMFRSIDGGTTGLAEASNLLYCDDLVKDVETANNKDRLDKLYYTYTSTIKDRKVPRLCKDGVYRPCPELHVNTPWSIYDVTNRIINIENRKGNNDRVRIISIPCWDENHESNFMYDYGKGFDVAYYEDMEAAEDPVIFSAKYLMKCIERDGRPFERDNLTYYTELPGDEPDRIVAYNDVSHGGEDYMSMPIAYVYGKEVYIVDVLFKNNFGGDSASRKWVRDKIVDYGISRCGFEKNNGGDFYSTLVTQDLKQVNYRCNITSHNAPTRQRKLDRILACQNEILGIDGEIMGNYRIYFKDPSMIPPKSEYMDFLKNLWGWSQKEGSIQQKQHDDAPDSLAGLIANVLGKRSTGSVKLHDIRDAGY